MASGAERIARPDGRPGEWHLFPVRGEGKADVAGSADLSETRGAPVFDFAEEHAVELGELRRFIGDRANKRLPLRGAKRDMDGPRSREIRWRGPLP